MKYGIIGFSGLRDDRRFTSSAVNSNSDYPHETARNQKR